MFTRSAILGVALLSGTLLFVPGHTGAQGGDERIYRALTTDQLEEMLSAEKLTFKKTENAANRGTWFYDFKRGAFNLRLTYFDGKDLMIDNFFARAVPLDRVNDWNKKAKFSRASLHRDKDGEFLMLEFNLDLLGGITRGTVKQFITHFEQECGNFDRFIGTGAANPIPVAGDKIHAQVNAAVVEQVLKNLKAEFKKQGGANGDTYDFKLDGVSVRLTNFNGKDLMIDAVFPKAGLTPLNKYNIDRKFVRAVYYNVKGNEYTALESNLDCVAGVTDEMIRYFITNFVADARHFSEYLGKQLQ